MPQAVLPRTRRTVVVALALLSATASAPLVPVARAGPAEGRDAFGMALHLGDANGDGRADLAVGAPGENTNSGSVWTFRSGAAGVVTGSGTSVFGNGLLGTDGTKARLGTGFAY
ncbi:FG-GAP repeat protein [Streptomyces sp. NPDC087903]|uniref:FG-GAP repeat protein n=1 Tax=Streptomyces sp. NPDC087903 TaxID=3365819 RepID=UPI00381D292F